MPSEVVGQSVSRQYYRLLAALVPKLAAKIVAFHKAWAAWRWRRPIAADHLTMDWSTFDGTLFRASNFASSRSRQRER